MLVSYLRTLLLYLVLLAAVRLLGKRQIGQLEASEFVVAMLVADLASIPMQDVSIPLYMGLVPILTVLGAEFVLAGLCLKSIRLRKILCGKPVILIENGRILQKNLSRTRVTQDELMGHLREKDILDVRTVQYAILETNGNLSVFPYAEHLPAPASAAKITVQTPSLPVSIIEDGFLFRQNLALAGKDLSWVGKILQKQDATLESTWLLTVDDQDHVLFVRKEETK